MKTIVVAPHPDDEVLGAGGTLLRRKAEGAKVAWLVVTAISCQSGWSEEQVSQRADEIKKSTKFFGFDEVFLLNFPTAQLDHVPMSELNHTVLPAIRCLHRYHIQRRVVDGVAP